MFPFTRNKMKTDTSGTLALHFYIDKSLRQFCKDGYSEFLLSQREHDKLKEITMRVKNDCRVEYWIENKHLETHYAINKIEANLIIWRLKNTERYMFGKFKII